MKIAFVGRMGAGKTTSAEYFKTQFRGSTFSWADQIRVEAYDLLSGALQSPTYIPVLKTPEPLRQDASRKTKIVWIEQRKAQYRELLQWWAQLQRAQDKDYWLTAGLERVEQGASINDDTRFPNEALALQKAGFVLVWVECPEMLRYIRLMERDGDVPPTTLNHETERQVDSLRPLCAYEVFNGRDTEHLYGQVRELHQELSNRL